MFIRRTIISLILLSGGRCVAERGDNWIDLNVSSWHSEKRYTWQGRSAEYNANNLGLGFTHELSDTFEVKTGWFRNSYEKTSVYGLVGWKRDLLQRSPWLLAPGVTGGLVSGYQNTPERTGEVTAWCLVMLNIGHGERWRANIGYLPSKLLEANGVELIVLQFSVKL